MLFPVQLGHSWLTIAPYLKLGHFLGVGGYSTISYFLTIFLALAISNKLSIIARIKSTAVNGCPPELMGLGPIGASKKALIRADLGINDMDIVELNEAFASQSLACIKELQINPGKVNIEGGAIALGHPLGATGVRITAKAASLMNDNNKRFALATQCIGLGQGIATVLERVE